MLDKNRKEAGIIHRLKTDGKRVKITSLSLDKDIMSALIACWYRCVNSDRLKEFEKEINEKKTTNSGTKG